MLEVIENTIRKFSNAIRLSAGSLMVSADAIRLFFSILTEKICRGCQREKAKDKLWNSQGGAYAPMVVRPPFSIQLPRASVLCFSSFLTSAFCLSSPRKPHASGSPFSSWPSHAKHCLAHWDTQTAVEA